MVRFKLSPYERRERDGKITTGRSEVSFSPKDTIFIPPQVPHGIENDGEEDVVMVFFFSRPEYPQTGECVVFLRSQFASTQEIPIDRWN